MPSSEAAPIQILHTARALCDLGAEVTVYTGAMLPPDEAAVLDHYGVVPHARLRVRALPTRLERVLALASAHVRSDVLVVRGERGARLLRLFGPVAPRFVLEMHRLSFTDDPATLAAALAGGTRQLGRTARVAHARERALVARAMGIVVLTRSLGDTVRALYRPTAQPLVVPSGTSLDTARPHDDDGDDGHMRDVDVLYAGKLLARKGVADLVAAMPHLEGLRLVLVGDRASADVDIDALARRLGVGERVRVVSGVAPRDMQAWWRRARVGVCPLPAGRSLVAERFTSPLKVVEMMAQRVPIVATDVPALRELLDDDTAAFARPGDPQSIAATIRALHADASRRARLATNAYAAVARRSWAARAELLKPFLERCLSSITK